MKERKNDRKNDRNKERKQERKQARKKERKKERKKKSVSGGVPAGRRRSRSTRTIFFKHAAARARDWTHRPTGDVPGVTWAWVAQSK